MQLIVKTIKRTKIYNKTNNLKQPAILCSQLSISKICDIIPLSRSNDFEKLAKYYLVWCDPNSNKVTIVAQGFY
jgi:hypothetical protein